jgi:hypothetical protein
MGNRRVPCWLTSRRVFPVHLYIAYLPTVYASASARISSHDGATFMLSLKAMLEQRHVCITACHTIMLRCCASVSRNIVTWSPLAPLFMQPHGPCCLQPDSFRSAGARRVQSSSCSKT